MDGMMGGYMAFGWLFMLLFLVFVVTGIVWLVLAIARSGSERDQFRVNQPLPFPTVTPPPSIAARGIEESSLDLHRGRDRRRAA